MEITDKELDRDIRNLSILWEDQHIPYVPLEEMDCYSEEGKEIFRQSRLKRQREAGII
ncbi:hypothetical protein [Litoribacter ruber]|uniref:hypothetical protein n=1 Tax=Litoribacter ruber TaxID=702568 RepID=UPI001BDAFAA3|nr:hypothetical protein [Litoribacter ruber]